MATPKRKLPLPDGADSDPIGVSSHETIDTAQKADRTLGASLGPVHLFFGWGGEQLEQAARIRAVTLDHLVRTHDVALGLRHFRAVLDHHPLREQALYRLVVVNQPDVAHHLGPETGIDQV